MNLSSLPLWSFLATGATIVKNPSKQTKQVAKLGRPLQDGGPWNVENSYPHAPVFSAANFLTEEEAAHVLARYGRSLSPARIGSCFGEAICRNKKRVADSATIPDPYLKKNDPVTWRIIQRMHAAARVPVEFGEYLEITRYPTGGVYVVHADDIQGRRATTIIAVLRGQESGLRGGELVFPFAYGQFREEAQALTNMPGFARLCPNEAAYQQHEAGQYLALTAELGKAVMFSNHLSPTMHLDSSMHGSCPIKNGEKWILQRWVQYPMVHAVNVGPKPGSTQHSFGQQARSGMPVWLNAGEMDSPSWYRGVIRLAYMKAVDGVAVDIFDVELLPELYSDVQDTRTHFYQMHFGVSASKLWPRSPDHGPPQPGIN
eukprot:gnl/MRDRNA2_/MRDRNA2_34873_c0_seq1.p1 gnl/MRDRNA2_/MRDRNA2_34873_c0~~gnl/MRDRNA2_/MRDRNA2_34873_c0_seq1.p1  ORF type:complete len:373 (-),score=40.36 gnl/MRDRNA2_/MRDRNA2_34873_c0_seq1:165-1283(-)